MKDLIGFGARYHRQWLSIFRSINRNSYHNNMFRSALETFWIIFSDKYTKILSVLNSFTIYAPNEDDLLVSFVGPNAWYRNFHCKFWVSSSFSAYIAKEMRTEKFLFAYLKNKFQNVSNARRIIFLWQKLRFMHRQTLSYGLWHWSPKLSQIPNFERIWTEIECFWDAVEKKMKMFPLCQWYCKHQS